MSKVHIRPSSTQSPLESILVDAVCNKFDGLISYSHNLKFAGGRVDYYFKPTPRLSVDIDFRILEWTAASSIAVDASVTLTGEPGGCICIRTTPKQSDWLRQLALVIFAAGVFLMTL